MIEERNPKFSKYNWIKRVAVVLTLVWACWWVMFAFFVIFSDGINSPIVMYPICIAGIFLLSAALAIKSHEMGGTLLILEGCLVNIAYPIISYNLPVKSIIFVLVTKGLPPLIAGILFVIYHYQSKSLEVNKDGE